jgi:hypothetical protein
MGEWISLFKSLNLPPVRVVAQPGSALGWGSRGRKFESCPPDLKPVVAFVTTGFSFLF